MPRLILISTRPAEDSAELASSLSDLDLELVALPASEPRLYPASAELMQQLLRPADLWFFPSRYPVAVLKYLTPEQRRRLRCACPGPGTAQALAEWEVGEIICPSAGYTSEALLAMPQLQSMAAQQVKILSAPGGREALAAGLAERGAQVATLTVYERYAAEPEQSVLARLEQCQQPWLSVITSGQGLAHLQRYLGARAWRHLCGNRALLPSQRLQSEAEALGLRQVDVLSPPDNSQINGYIRTNFDSLIMQPQG